MQATPSSEPTLQDLANKLQDLANKLDALSAKFEELAKEQKQSQQWQEKSQQWQDRTWDVVKWVGGISAGLAISASIALVGIVLKFATGN